MEGGEGKEHHWSRRRGDTLNVAARSILRRRAWLCLLFVVGAAIAQFLFPRAQAGADPVCGDGTFVEPGRCVYSSTAEDAFTVPAGVTSVNVVAVGGRGGSGGASFYGGSGDA